MDSLTYTLQQLCQRNRDGSHTTQADRLRSLKLMAEQLREIGFRQLRATRLNGKHTAALLERWRRDRIATGTLKNRLAHLRWWAEKVGKEGLLPTDNTKLGIPAREFVSKENKAQQLDERLSKITDPHVRMSLVLQQAFGLRREESIKFQPRYADRGDRIVLKGSWTKGGREREIPILTAAQRLVLNQAHELAKAGSLIPAHLSYIQQRGVYDHQCKAAGLSRMHGLRHQYAQARYEALTGWKAPIAGGPPSDSLNERESIQDHDARQLVSRELGHERMEITNVYLGR